MADETRSQAEPDVLPLLLFDGVCNLCNAAVRWVIDRDRQAVFRFASLQSDAGRRALAAAGVELPDGAGDTLVLVDERGAHTRSTAALRVARRLGWPYSLLALGVVVPRFLRDGIYRWVSTHRYRWFGRRDLCAVPDASLAARFLDAGESPAPAPAPVGGSSSVAIAEPASMPAGAAPRRSWAAAWLPRFAIAYVLVYMAPFPLTLLGYLAGLPILGPVLGWVVGLHGMYVNPLVEWVGRSAFGVQVTQQFTGSGDTTFNYLDLLVDAVLALAISVVWAARTRRRPVGARTLDVAQVMARYYLATTMLTYGWLKVFPLQFPVPGPDRLLQPYGDSSPMGLAWTFLGASVGYQMFAGLAELTGGYLLLWRRTALAGALVSAAVMTNVAAINFFYDVPVKLFSGHLVLVAVFILAPDLPRLVTVLSLDLPVAPRSRAPFWRRRPGLALRVTALHLLFVLALTTVHVAGALQASRSRGLLAEPSPLSGVYRVESFRRAGRIDAEVPDAERWVRVGLAPPFVATVQRASGDAVRMRLVLDTDGGTLSLFDRGARPPAEPTFALAVLDDGRLELSGTFEEAETVVTLRRQPDDSLLLSRGFHWINEYPFNR